ncbi:MAG TPA: tripartite tricarboxylate transporter TctB family protein [Candidatus Acidoferrum sp.]|nr:tripartite tricarboxylate transporter TctB family protein [Candidatus Acidoferrum sp.]
MKRIRSEVAGSLFWLGVGAFFAVGGLLLKPGTPRNPGPGFLPLVMALILVSLSLFVLAKGLMAPAKYLQAIQWKRQAALLASVFAYGWLLDFAGFLLSTFGLMFALFALLSNGKGRWPRVFLYAAATALIGWLVFSVALKVPFPQGRLMGILGWPHGLLR